MAWYHFKGTNAFGHAVQGECGADSELMLTSRLQAAGVTSIVIKKMSIFATGWAKVKECGSRFFPIRKADLSLFYYQLADMLEVGISLKNALCIMVNHLSNPGLIRVVNDLVATLSKGASFGEALRKHQRLFSPVTVHLISFAQSTEELVAMLRYCDQAMQRLTFSKRIFFMAIPQLSIMIVLFAALFFLRLRYLPAFNYAIFVFNNPVPSVIRIFEFITGLFTVHLLKTLVIAFLIFVGFKVLTALSKHVRLFYHALLCYFPVMSGVVFSVERERLALLYSVLLKGGASAQKCAQYGIAVIHNLFFQRRVKAMFFAVQRGEGFSSAMRYFRVFNSAEVQMIALGAVSSSLVKAFERIYKVSQIALERKLFALLEFIRLCLYLFNTTLFFFVIYVTETLFYYPGVHG